MATEGYGKVTQFEPGGDLEKFANFRRKSENEKVFRCYNYPVTCNAYEFFSASTA